MPKKIKLKIELIPKTSHGFNARKILTKKEWDEIRKLIYEQANHKCEICGQTGLEQGYSHKVECHEIWKFNKKEKIQKLVGLIALCPLCHGVKHIGRSILFSKEKETVKQLKTVNKWTKQQAIKYITESFEKCKKLSQHIWKLDLSILKKAPYNVKNKKINKNIKNKP
jgi:5-methylcytosine-specific restriction endonuclease McrA